jgi:hypothetical protein
VGKTLLARNSSSIVLFPSSVIASFALMAAAMVLHHWRQACS